MSVVLMEKLGYIFHNPKLLQSALSHRSLKKDNNERLEFLGDAILNFLIADIVYHHFSEAAEGKLSRLRSNLVNQENLAEIAKGLDLGPYLILGPGEKKGEERASILADALEAVIAAIYLDSDLAICRAVIHPWFQASIKKYGHLSIDKDAKTRLQEWLQSKKMALPHYSILEIQGEAHNQTFIITCSLSGIKEVMQGVGKTRRAAEQDAANAFLEHFKKGRRG